MWAKTCPPPLPAPFLPQLISDLSKNTALGWLYCENNCLKSLNLKSNTHLKELEVYYNQLTKLDISHNKELQHAIVDHGVTVTGNTSGAVIDVNQ